MTRHLAYVLPIVVHHEMAEPHRYASVVVCRVTSSTTALVRTTRDPAQATCGECLRARGDGDRARQVARLREDLRRAIDIAHVWNLDLEGSRPPSVLHDDVPARLPAVECPTGTSLDAAFVMRRNYLEAEAMRLRTLIAGQRAHAARVVAREVA